MSKETIGPRIKKFRKERKLTQEVLAESLGYSGKSVISHIEKGDADMTYEKILLLFRKYSLDANEFFEVEDIDKKLADYRMERRKNRKVIVYIHGLNGSIDETNDYSYLNNEYDVIGLYYEDGNPWEVKDVIRNEFKSVTEKYKEVIVIANSIGAFYTYAYLSDFNIKKAYFISPIASMSQIILNIMMKNGIHWKELEEKKFIKVDGNMTLSYDFYKFVEGSFENFKVPTEVLYGSRDELVYIENIMEYMENHPNARLTVMKDAEHYFHKEEEKEFIKKWILQSL